MLSLYMEMAFRSYPVALGSTRQIIDELQYISGGGTPCEGPGQPDYTTGYQMLQE